MSMLTEAEITRSLWDLSEFGWTLCNSRDDADAVAARCEIPVVVVRAKSPGMWRVEIVREGEA